MNSIAERAPAMPNVLLVDDAQDNLVTMQQALSPLDIQIVTATSSIDALNILQHQPFAAILLDVSKLESDGFEVASFVRSKQITDQMPVMLIIDRPIDDSYLAHLSEISMVDCIYKPMNINILRGKIRFYCEMLMQKNELKNINQSLSHKNEELERFAYICSHDMQEPARMMSAFSDILNKEYSRVLDEHATRYLKFINDNANHMQNMIHDILTFSRAGLDEPLAAEHVDCNAVVSQIRAKLGGLTKDAGATTTCDTLPNIFTNSTLIHILFQNLISNSLKFREPTRPLTIHIGLEENMRAWCFSVKDNGMGIEPIHHDKVFEMFKRIHRRDQIPCTGIGLNTCKKLLDRHQGKIWFDTIFGSGTTFYFTIPKRSATIKHLKDSAYVNTKVASNEYITN